MQLEIGEIPMPKIEPAATNYGIKSKGGNLLPVSVAEIKRNVTSLERYLNFQSVHDNLHVWLTLRTQKETAAIKDASKKIYHKMRLAMMRRLSRWVAKNPHKKMPSELLFILKILSLPSLDIDKFFEFMQSNMRSHGHLDEPIGRRGSADAISVKFLHRIANSLKITSPKFFDQNETKEITTAWINKHVERWVCTSFGTNEDCFLKALASGGGNGSGRLQLMLPISWKIRDEEGLRARRKEFDVPALELNAYADHYRNAILSLLFRKSVKEITREYGVDFVKQNFPSSINSDMPLFNIAPQYIYYVSKTMNWNLDFLNEPIVQHVRFLAATGIITADPGVISKWTVSNVLDSYIGCNAVRLQKEEEQKQAVRAGYMAKIGKQQPIHTDSKMIVHRVDNTLDRITIAAYLSHVTESINVCVGAGGGRRNSSRGGGRYTGFWDPLKPDEPIDLEGVGRSYLDKVTGGSSHMYVFYTTEMQVVAISEMLIRNGGAAAYVSQTSGVANGPPDKLYKPAIDKYLTAILEAAKNG